MQNGALTAYRDVTASDRSLSFTLASMNVRSFRKLRIAPTEADAQQRALVIAIRRSAWRS